MESISAGAVTPEEERELKFPVREEQPPSKNFTPVQLIVLFLQFCLVGVFLGGVIFNVSDQKEEAFSKKMLVVAVEREKKAGGGIKYRLITGKKGGIEAIILENLPSHGLLATLDDTEANDETTPDTRWMTSSERPLMIIKEKQQYSSTEQLSIAKYTFRPSPPVPPPWSSTTSWPLLSGYAIMQQRSKANPTTRASFKITHGSNGFYRG